ncbi:MAG TPA: hypothetical protein PK821_03535 [Victivallales bacterium]|nr:hypothetical protein [Victivallales bacterium]
MKKTQRNPMTALLLSLIITVSLAIFASDTVSLTVRKGNATEHGKLVWGLPPFFL